YVLTHTDHLIVGCAEPVIESEPLSSTAVSKRCSRHFDRRPLNNCRFNKICPLQFRKAHNRHWFGIRDHRFELAVLRYTFKPNPQLLYQWVPGRTNCYFTIPKIRSMICTRNCCTNGNPGARTAISRYANSCSVVKPAGTAISS